MANGAQQNEKIEEIFVGFLETMISLHTLISESAHSVLRIHDANKRLDDVVIKLGFHGPARQKFEDWIDSYTLEKVKAQKEGIATAEIDERFRGRLTEIIEESAGSMHRSASKAEIDLLSTRHKFRPEPTAVLNRATLVTAVGAFEGLIVSLVQAYMRENPLQGATSEKEFNLADIVRAGNVDELIQQSTARRAESVLRGGLDGWASWFHELGVDFQNLCISWNGVVEIFERRHALIHTRGRVNQTYKRKVGLSARVGEPLEVDSDYLLQAVGALTCLGVLITFSFWPKIDKDIDRDIVAGVPLLYLDDLMAMGHWAAVRKIANVVKNSSVPLDLKLHIRCFEWVAAKQIDGILAIEKAVKAWDTSALRSVYSFRRALLLEDFSEAKSIYRNSKAIGEPWCIHIVGLPEVRHCGNVMKFVEQLAVPAFLSGDGKASSPAQPEVLNEPDLEI